MKRGNWESDAVHDSLTRIRDCRKEILDLARIKLGRMEALRDANKDFISPEELDEQRIVILQCEIDLEKAELKLDAIS